MPFFQQLFVIKNAKNILTDISPNNIMTTARQLTSAEMNQRHSSLLSYI